MLTAVTDKFTRFIIAHQASGEKVSNTIIPSAYSKKGGSFSIQKGKYNNFLELYLEKVRKNVINTMSTGVNITSDTSTNAVSANLASTNAVSANLASTNAVSTSAKGKIVKGDAKEILENIQTWFGTEVKKLDENIIEPNDIVSMTEMFQDDSPSHIIVDLDIKYKGYVQNTKITPQIMKNIYSVFSEQLFKHFATGEKNINQTIL
jgi:hypothetical protein